MMIDFLGWVERRRVLVLAVSLVVAVGLAIVAHRGDWRVVLAVTVVLYLGLTTFLVVAIRSYHLAKLVARPEVSAVEPPANPGLVLGAAAYTLFGVLQAGPLLDSLTAGDGTWSFGVGVFVFYAFMLTLFWRSALGRFGVRLTPDGIADRQVFGSRSIPWESLSTPVAAFAYNAQQVTLFFERPELVRKRGLRIIGPNLLPAGGVNAELLARAIHEYANRPDLRPAIGTEAELARFMAIPQIAELASA